jgi:hypothetical protein
MAEGPIITVDTYIDKDRFEVSDDGRMVRLKFHYDQRESVHIQLAEWIRQVELVCGEEVHHYIPLPKQRILR